MRVTITAVCALVGVWWAIYHCSNTTPRDPKIKRILTWTPFFGDKYYYFGGGSPAAFQAAGCAVSACEIEADKRRAPLEVYDALLFHGYEYYDFAFGVPNKRLPHQIYTYMCLEPMRTCSIPERLTNFYNHTMTYRIDSDTPWPYFAFVDIVTGKDVAPAFSPDWKESELGDDPVEAREIAQLISEKDKLAAWFVSNCNSESDREKVADDLAVFGAPVDIYGRCGPLSCPRSESDRCRNLLREYYFYLAFENSLCVDYITEKVAEAYIGGAVPVVLSGANLTRFLPPGSYIEVNNNNVKEGAERLQALVTDKTKYSKYFAWKTRYKVERRGPGFQWPPGEHPFCKLCALLHNENQNLGEHEEVRSWWHRTPSGGPACISPHYT